jgi:Polysaccharide pyruvyl transferase
LSDLNVNKALESGTAAPRRLRAVVLNDTAITGHPGCVRVMQMLRKGLRRSGIDVTATCPVGVDFEVWPGVRKHIAIADIVVINAEGTIHHTTSRAKARNLVTAARRIKMFRKVPVVIVNASMEALEASDIQDLRYCDEIYVRESVTLSYLKHMQREAKLSADLTLAEPLDLTLAERSGLFVTDSVLKSRAIELRQAAKRLGGEFQVMRPSKYWAYSAYFLNFNLLERYSSSYSRSIARAERSLTGRFHAMLFCMAQNTPFAAVSSNSSKVEAVLQDAFSSNSRLISGVNSLESVNEIQPFAISEIECLRLYRSLSALRIRDMFDDLTLMVRRCAAYK